MFIFYFNFLKLQRLTISPSLSPSSFRACRCERWRITSAGARIVTSDSPDEGTVVCGREDGSLLVLGLPPSQFQALEETDLRQISPLGRLMGGLMQQSKANQGQFLVALRVFSHIHVNEDSETENTFAFALSADRRLRIWSLQSRTCLKTVDLADQNDAVSSPLPPIPTSFLQLYCETVGVAERGDGAGNLSHVYKLVLLLPLQEQSIFQVYRFTVDENTQGKLLDFKLEREVSAPILPRQELVDFGLTLKTTTLPG